MALDDSVHQFVNKLLEVRPIRFSGLDGSTEDALLQSAFKIRLLRLWSAMGKLRGGVGRVESPDTRINGFWLVFSNPSFEIFDFTDRLTRFQIFLGSQEPVDVQAGIPVLPDATSAVAGFAQIAAVGMGPVPGRYSALSAQLRTQLETVPISGDGSLAYRPCDVLLKDGRRVDRVYVVPEEPYSLLWGVWPEDDKGKNAIPIDDVASLQDSVHRLPAPLANKLYAAGESGMGYVLFTVMFDDSARLAIVAGNAVDFIEYPAGKGPQNVVDVLPHVGRDSPDLHRAPAYQWCLYSE